VALRCNAVPTILRHSNALRCGAWLGEALRGRPRHCEAVHGRALQSHALLGIARRCGPLRIQARHRRAGRGQALLYIALQSKVKY